MSRFEGAEANQPVPVRVVGGADIGFDACELGAANL